MNAGEGALRAEPAALDGRTSTGPAIRGRRAGHRPAGGVGSLRAPTGRPPALSGPESEKDARLRLRSLRASPSRARRHAPPRQSRPSPSLPLPPPPPDRAPSIQLHLIRCPTLALNPDSILFRYQPTPTLLISRLQCNMQSKEWTGRKSR